MDKLEPIDLLKRELAIFKKAIDKCTVSNYNEVSANLNPLIERYKEVIQLLQPTESEYCRILDKENNIYKCFVEPLPTSHKLKFHAKNKPTGIPR
jgi:hypothetical protein